MRNKLFFLLTATAIFFACTVNSQNFLKLTLSNSGQTINLASTQVIEIKLPATPSTGYNWYITNMDKGVIKTIGDDEFLSDQSKDMVGQLGTKIIRIAGVSQGSSELTLEYKRLWEKDKTALASYNVTIVSGGKYAGDYVPPVRIKPSQKIQPSATPKSLPSSFSWQSECTPVKNQYSCGSCWAFAGCGTFEASINIWDHVVKDLSEQWLVNCATDMYGCSGGYSPHGYWVTPGAVYENDVPYVSHDDTCMSPYPYHEQAIDYGTVYSDADIKQKIYDYGSVWICVFASGSNFMGYTGGIVTTNEGTQIDHAVVLVGWKDTLLSNGSTGYWILRNSWGSSWGENGYMRISYGVNQLGGSTGTSWVNYRGIIPHVLTASFSANTVCGNAPLNVQFTQNSYTPFGTTINSWLWDFGDGSTSTSQIPPPHSYTNPGIYTVSLTITNTASVTHTLTKSSYILVVTPTTTYNMSNTIITTCAGGFFDSGGFNGVFQGNENKTMTFLPDAAGNKLQIVFAEFNIYADPYNYLKVYDGTSISAPLIGTYSAINVPGTITATNADGALTFVFYSNDWAWGRPGWSASINCVSSTPVLTVSTSAITAITATSATVGGNVTNDGGQPVTARGICGGLTASPTILDFHTSDGTGTGNFSSNIPGLTANTTYHIRAYAINSLDTAYGSDVMFTTLPTNNPVADFTGSPTTIIEGGQIIFTNQSTGTITSYNWSFPGGTPSTATGAGPHTITYYTAGVYDAALTVGTPANTMTKTNYVTVNVPEIIFNMSSSTVSTCSGNFYDSGGDIGAYQNYEDLTMTFLPDVAGNKLQMVFAGFDVEAEPTCGYDYLQVFDGTSTNSPLIGKYCGTISPGTVTATNVDGALTYVFHSDQLANGLGWEASINCLHTCSTLTVTTTVVLNITSTTASSGGNILNDGGQAVTARGICWGTSVDPDISGMHTSDGNGIGVFVSNITGLTANTTYYVRAYAINSADTAYGNDLTFNTLSASVNNDDCASAVTLVQTATCNPTSGTTVDATQSIPSILCAGYTSNSANDVWYKFNATTVTPVITVVGSSIFDPVIDLRSGSCSGININCSDVTGSGGIETLNATGLSIGSTYYVRVYPFATAGTFTICVNDGTVGITQNSVNAELLISPNPTTGIINIANAENNMICIYNSIGIVVCKKIATEKVTTIDLSHLSSGSYLIQVIKDHSIMKKINLIK